MPKKDPNKPKGRTSAYAFFLQHRREQYKKQGENVHFTVFSKECAELWRGMKDGEKTRFFKLAEEDRSRYTKEMARYVPPEDAASKNGKRRRNKAPKDPNKPKRPLSDFMWFLKDKRPKYKEQFPSATVGDSAKQLAAAWSVMTEEQKAPYKLKYKKDHERYEQEMAEYKSRGGGKPALAVEEEEEEEEEEDYSDED